MAWPCQLTVGSCLSIRIVGYKAVSLSTTAPDEYALRLPESSVISEKLSVVQPAVNF